MKDKQVLSAVLSLRLLGRKPTARQIGERLGVGAEESNKEVDRLQRKGLLAVRRGEAALTDKGRRGLRVVFIGGAFEVIHQGHLYTIDSAKALGDVLVVAVARDSTIRRRKKREPISGEVQRADMLSSLRQVDAAILGVEGDIYETLEKVKPDIVALGYDQHHAESEVAREAARRGLKLKVVRLDSPFPKVKTSALLREL